MKDLSPLEATDSDSGVRGGRHFIRAAATFGLHASTRALFLSTTVYATKHGSPSTTAERPTQAYIIS